MAKPAQLPEWGTDQSNEVEPTAGQKTTGWTPNQTAVSSYFNWLLRIIYEWLAYLNAGALEGNHSIDGTLDVTGVVTATAGVDVGANNLKYTSKRLTISPFSLVTEDPVNDLSVDTNGKMVLVNGAVGTIPVLAAEVGQTITAYSIYAQQTAAGTLTIELRVGKTDGTSDLIDTFTTIQTTMAVWGRVLPSSRLLALGEHVFLNISTSGAGVVNVAGGYLTASKV